MAEVAYIPARYHGGPFNLPIKRLVVHCTTGPCQPGQARITGTWFQDPRSGGSAHKGIDPAEVVRYLPDETIGYHAPPNQYSLGYEFADPMTGDPNRWTDPMHVAMLSLGAAEFREDARKHGVPITRIETPGLRNGLRGITGHDDVSKAWGMSDHWDPGPYFPWGTFLGMVAGIVDKEAAMSAETEQMLRENWMRLIQQQGRQASSDRALVAASIPIWYKTYLGRDNPSRSEVASWLVKYDQGYGPHRIEQAIRASKEADRYAARN